MKRSMFQAYVKGSDKAVEMYKEAFDATIVSSYPNTDGTYYHCELDVYGQIFAVSETPCPEKHTGNTMQFCLHFGEGGEALVHKAYDVLKEGGEILYPLSSTDYTPLMVDIVDRFGVRWCIFV